MTADNIIAWTIYLGIAFLVARNTYQVSGAKKFDPQLAGVLSFAGTLVGIIPGLLINLIYRLVKPRDKWSF